MMKYIVTNARERWARTAVMLLSILLSTTLLFVSFSIGTSYESAQRKMARGMAGSATVSVTATGEKSDIRPEELPGLSAIGASVGIREASAMYHANGYYESIDLLATDLAQLDSINKPRLLSGEEITDFTGNVIILPDRFTSKYGLQKGDSLDLQIAGQSVRFQLAEVAAYDTVFLRHTRGATALVPLATLNRLLGERDGYSKILIKPAAGISTDNLIGELGKTLPDNRYQVSRTVNEVQIAADARQKTMPFFLISFFSLTISVFIIYSSYKVIILDRLPILGTFRSIGATEQTVTRILLMESLFYGTLGGLIGIPAGLLMLKWILGGLGSSLAQGIAIPLVISVPGVIVSVAVAVVVSLLSAWLPVRRASRLPIKDVVLGTVEERRMPRRLIVVSGLALFVLSVILPMLTSGKGLYLAGGFSLLGLLAATIIIIPLLTNWLSRGLEGLYGLFSNEGKLAARNMRDNQPVTQNITLLFISISAVIAISVVGSFVTTYIGDVFRGAKLQGFVDAQMEPDFVERVEKMDGISKVLPLFVFKQEVQGNGQVLSRLEATDDVESYSDMFALHYTTGRMREQVISAFGAEERSLIMSESGLAQKGLAVGDTLTLSNGDATYAYVIAGSFKSRATDVEAVIPAAYAVSDFGKTTYGFLGYTAADPDAIMVQLRDLLGDTPNWSRTVEEFNQDALATVSAFLQPMHSMTYFILLLATVGVINNLLIHFMQKRRSTAMYKSIGLSNWQHVRITLIEGFSCGLISAILAIGVSYMEIKTIFLVAGPKIAMVPQFQVQTFLLAGGLGILVTLLGSVVPIWKSRRMKIVEELKFE
jgi:ABC-type antimicrobial peptide transport system permease subunit